MTHGNLTLQKGYWILQTTPHVRIKVKRLFLGVKDQGSVLTIKATPDTTEDMQWILSRYPHDTDFIVRDYMRLTVAASKERREKAERILHGSHVPLNLPLALPLREYQEQAVNLARLKPGLLIGDDLGLGKEQPVSEPTPTPGGWKRFGELQPGDLVFAANGQPTPVEAVFPQGVKAVYKVEFSDGSFARCGIEHLWQIETRSGRQAKAVSLAEILSRGLHEPNGKPRFWIPRQGAADFRRAILMADPYFAGVVIGDGCVTDGQHGVQVTISTRDNDIIEGLPEPMSRREAHGCSQLYYGADWLRLMWAVGIKGTSHEKRVPPAYLTADIEQRTALLHGLMDTDGSCIKNRTVFHSCNPGLAQDVKALVDSLGGLASIRKYDRSKEGKSDDYQVRIQTPFCPFLTEAKKSQWFPIPRGKTARRSIISITPDGEEESRCIRVAGGLYLTRDFVVTHNTAAAIGIVADGNNPAIVVCLTHLQRQWQKEFAKFAPHLKCHIIRQNSEYSLPPHNVTICSYSKIAAWADRMEWKAVVWDEIQELRRPGTKKAAAAGILAHGCATRIGLSATPMYNYAGEIFNVMEALTPGELGTEYEFLKEWGIPHDHKGRVKDPVALGAWLRGQNIYIRRTRSEVGRELAPIEKVTHVIDYDASVIERLRGQCNELAERVLKGSFTERGMAARNLDIKLRQVTGIAKGPAVADFVRQLVENGEPVLLAGWHRDVYTVWEREFKAAGITYGLYTGSESESRKAANAAKFIAGELQVLIICLRSGAGLNGLQNRSNIVVFGELDWSPAVGSQLIGRLRRDGQTKPVTAFYLVSEGGADPIMAQVLAAKWTNHTAITDPHLVTGQPQEEPPESRVADLAKHWLRRAS